MRRAKPFIAAIAIAGLYILAVRPLRGVIVQDLIYHEALLAAKHKAGIKITDYSPQRIEVTLKSGVAHPISFSYGMAFGAYFLILLMLFVLFRTNRNWIVRLFFFHCAFFLAETGFLFLGLSGSYVSLQGMDLLYNFLFPASFGIAALAWFETRDGKAPTDVDNKTTFVEGDTQN